MASPFNRIFVEMKDTGKLVDITELPREQYEIFIELMGALGVAYWTAVSRKVDIKEEQQ